ncbi:hypothetical protein AM493_03225 [Flavobacterium akiainvivens]|uniref:Uncharacterized protein n=1 Tax=Flavobacterium akiainvivens TaxID=1202724 RepID=A0A0N0RQF1_9FLAO|nr:hypothetical protein [Flavobacterium akiainvivens]KOS05156.1 hypothetical protein AM493_03225 [Flavobacterium akiainvivens]SFQ51060.1 hypothetical protein SAMN05444144_106159 [Flavobacterium akiainvivens]
MKRIFILSFVFALLAGCAKKGQAEGGADSTATDSATKVTAPAPNAKRGIAPAVVLNIPVDRSKVNTSWYKANKTYIDNENGNTYYVDLESVGNMTAIATWLGQNDTYIKFSELYPITVSRHQITSADSTAYAAVTAVAPTGFKAITYMGLKDALGDAGIDTNDQYDDLFKVNLTGTAITVTKRPYECADGVYSTPLINGIVTQNSLSNPTFHFAQATIGSSLKTFIKVTEGSFVGYYDLSTNPPLN